MRFNIKFLMSAARKRKKLQEDTLMNRQHATIVEQENMLRIYKNRILELEQEVKAYQKLYNALKMQIDRTEKEIMKSARN